jgi:hypothetical protein
MKELNVWKYYGRTICLQQWELLMKQILWQFVKHNKTVHLSHFINKELHKTQC